LVETGQLVRTGEPLVSVRCRDEAWSALQDAVASAVSLAEPNGEGTADPLASTLEVVRVGPR
jgi:hypothetical protein